MVSRSLCIAFNEAIKDEMEAPKMYKKLIKHLKDEGLLTKEKEDKLRTIIEQEMSHELDFIKMAEEFGCSVDTGLMPFPVQKEKRVEFCELPLKERLRMAREFISRQT